MRNAHFLVVKVGVRLLQQDDDYAPNY